MPPKCFVIMPITTPSERVRLYDGDPDHFLHVIDYLFEPAIEQAGYEIIKPAFNNSEVIQGEIIRNLVTADLVLCDISDWNANVFFELGIRVALNKPVAMVRDSQTPNIPFDNAGVSCHQYDSRLSAWCVEAEVPKLRALIETVGMHEQNSLWKYFGIAQRAKQSEPGDVTQAKLDLLSADVESLRAMLKARLHSDLLHSDLRKTNPLDKFHQKFSGTSVSRLECDLIAARIPIGLIDRVNKIYESPLDERTLTIELNSSVDDKLVELFREAAKEVLPEFTVEILIP